MTTEKNKEVIAQECEEMLQELHDRASNSTSKNINRVKFADYTTEQLHQKLKESQKLVYGNDDRKDLYQVTDPEIQILADSVVSLISNNRISNNGDNTSTILTESYAEEYDLCSGEKFREQPVAPFCSGFLVAPDIVATAGHCVTTSNLPTVNFVFGFRMIDSSEAQVIIPNKDIYRGTGLIARKLEDNGADYALVRLDRPVTDHKIVSIRRSGKINNREDVFVIGHPSGLPLKFANGAKVKNNSPSSFFEANLDTYGGNSGSPVFSKNDHTVEGILVRGEVDYVRISGCWRSNFVSDNGIQGEDVTRTTEFASFIDDADGRLVADSNSTMNARVDKLETLMQSIADDLKYIKDNM